VRPINTPLVSVTHGLRNTMEALADPATTRPASGGRRKRFLAGKEAQMNPPTHATLFMQTTSPPLPSTPWWCEAVVMIAQHSTGVLAKIPERVRVARRRCGR